ncbi:MAG: cupredoxin family copper-binding protein [Candidatus Doudnabacteria bacterium]
MDPVKPTNTPPIDESDLSYQIMPQDGHFEPSAEIRSSSMPPSGVRQNAAAAPPPPPKPSNSAYSSPVDQGNILMSEPEPSFFQSKWAYIVVGFIVLLILGLGSYLLFVPKKSTTPVPVAVVTKLPKVWLLQYFNNEVCADQTYCGDAADPDQDGLSNYDEFKASTNPTNPDSDLDGLADGDEVNIYKTEPTSKFTDRRDIVQQNNWLDGFQLKNGYDPLAPGIKFTDARKQQIGADVVKFGLHEPTMTTLGLNADGTANTNAPSPIPVPPSITHAVSIRAVTFSPASITIKKGETVTWTNDDTVTHTVTGDNGGPASQNIPIGDTYNFTFSTAGTFNYHCTIHPLMKGTVIVQ